MNGLNNLLSNKVISTGIATLLFFNFCQAMFNKNYFRPLQLRPAHSCIALSPDGKQLIISAGRPPIIINGTPEIEKNKEYRTLETAEGKNYIEKMAFSFDGRFFATAGCPGYGIKIWSTSDWACIAQAGYAHQGNQIFPCVLKFSHDGFFIAVGFSDGSIELWRTDPLKCIHIFPNQIDRYNEKHKASSFERDATVLQMLGKGHKLNCEPVVEIAFGLGSATFLSSSQNGKIRQHETSGIFGSRKIKIKNCYSREATFNIISTYKNGRLFAMGSYDGIVTIYDGSKCITSFIAYKSPICALAFSKDGQLLITTSHNKALKVWNTRTGNRIYSCPLAKIFPNFKEGLDLFPCYPCDWLTSPNGEYLCAAPFNGCGCIVSIPTAEIFDTAVA